MDNLNKLINRVVGVEVYHDTDTLGDDALNDWKLELKEEVKTLIAEAYKQGHIDGSIEVINGTCEICHSYPMTANCNNAGCDK